MNRCLIAAWLGALVLHAGVLLFGGLLLPHRSEGTDAQEDVALFAEPDPEKSDEAEKKDERDKVKADRQQDEDIPPEIAEPSEPLPDLQDLARLDSPSAGRRKEDAQLVRSGAPIFRPISTRPLIPWEHKELP